MTLNVAIVGCGKIADAHVEAVLGMPDTARLVAVCDVEILLAEQLAARYSIARHYDNLDEMLVAETPDVVHVTTPPQSHFSIAVRAIDAGCHVYVEKPLTPDHADAIKLIEYARTAGRKLTIGCGSFFDPPALEMRELIAKGVLGAPIHMESFYGYPLSGPFGSVMLSDERHWVHGLPGKLLQNNLDHPLSKVVEFLDDEAPRLHIAAYRRQPPRYGDVRDEVFDELRVLVAGEQTSAYVTFSAHAQPLRHFATVYGTKNTLHVDYVARTVSVERASAELGALGRAILPLAQAKQQLRAGLRNLGRLARSEFHYFAGMHRLIALFYESIENDSPPPIAYRDILRISAMIQEVIRQLPQRIER